MSYHHCCKVKNKNLAIITIPKVAASSMQRVIEIDGKCVPNEAKANGMFIAAFARNPYDRILSAWSDKCREEGMTPGLSRMGMYEGMPFEEFVMICASRCMEDHHTRPQSVFLMNRGQMLADFIGRFERLAEDWANLSSMFNLAPLPHLNKSGSQEKVNHWNDKLRRVVRKTYRSDFKLLGYR